MSADRDIRFELPFDRRLEAQGLESIVDRMLGINRTDACFRSIRCNIILAEAAGQMCAQAPKNKPSTNVNEEARDMLTYPSTRLFRGSGRYRQHRRAGAG